MDYAAEILALKLEIEKLKKQVKGLEGYKNYDWFLKGK